MVICSRDHPITAGGLYIFKREVSLARRIVPQVNTNTIITA